jgi:uncharacterized repeat protein (TIGR03803 family)
MKSKILLFLLVLNYYLPNVNAQYSKLFDFSGISTGSKMFGDVISDSTYHYGMTYEGGIQDSGTIFKILPDGTGYQKLLDFNGSNGSNPYGSLLKLDSFLYGMTMTGGLNYGGVIFKIKIDGTSFTKLHDFGDYNSATNGSNPLENLSTDGTWLYGTTIQGGAFAKGTIFKIKPDGTSFTLLFEFDGINGEGPHSTLLHLGNYLYGTTMSGGQNSIGTLFKILPDGSGHEIIFNFDGTSNGGKPLGYLISDGTFLYGMNLGGPNSTPGILYKIKPDSTSFQILKIFTGNSDGYQPFGSLILVGNTLYGFTNAGGSVQTGNIFKIQTDGSAYTQIYDFQSSSLGIGIDPFGTPLYENGYIYGTTMLGGTYGKGVLFRLNLNLVSNYETVADDNIIFPNPVSNILQIQSSENINKISCVNLWGQTIELNIENNLIDVSNLSDGIYFLIITKNDGKYILNKFTKI